RSSRARARYSRCACRRAKRHEPAAPPISASGIGCCRVAGRLADREGASLPVSPCAYSRRLCVGGPLDTSARLIAQWLSERLGQQFIIENRPGAASNIATEAVVRARPDGYTLLQASASNAWNAALYDNLSFNFIRDIAPIATVRRAGGVM